MLFCTWLLCAWREVTCPPATGYMAVGGGPVGAGALLTHVRLGPSKCGRPLPVLYDGGDVEVRQVCVSCEERGQHCCAKGQRCDPRAGALTPRGLEPLLTLLIQQNVVGLDVSAERAESGETSFLLLPNNPGRAGGPPRDLQPAEAHEA